MNTTLGRQRSRATLWVIADVTDPDAIQTILAHLKQRAPPDAGASKDPVKRRETISLPLADG